MGPLVVLEDTLNGPLYPQLLGDHLHPILAFQHPDDLAVFQDDNALPHRSNVVREWFKEHAGEVQRLNCPPRSPHMNTNEHIILDAVELRLRVLDPPPTNRTQFVTALQTVWCQCLRKCTRDMQTHFHAVSLRSAGPEGARPDIR